MDRFTFCKFNKNMSKFKKIFNLNIFFLIGFAQATGFVFAKSANNNNQHELIGATNRFSNNELYSSNLASVLHPTEEQLYKEAHLKQSTQLNQSYDALVRWYANKLSKNEKLELSDNCAQKLKGFKTYFPMTEDTLACAGWWLDERIESLVKNKIDPTRSKKQVFRLKNLDKNNWYKYKNLSLISALSNMHSASFADVQKLAKTALSTKYPCAYKNANFALIARLEDFLPQKEAYENITKIYNKSAHCYAPNQELSERIHLRVGVIHLVNGNNNLAKQALLKTRREKNPQDESRSLFWLGEIEKNQTKNQIKNQQNKYWQQLIKKNPLGFFSLLAYTKLNQDPQKDFVPDKSITLQNRVTGGWNELNLQSFLFDLFYAKKSQNALEVLSVHVTNSKASHKDLNLYWAVAHNIAQNDRASITKLAHYFAGQKYPKFSKELVKLNFPLKYSNEILRRSKKVDPFLVLALIRQESAFDANARSHANARGLMQMLPSTARLLKKRVSENELYDPQTNINLGISYLESLFEKYNGRTDYVLAAYNAGPHRVDAWSLRLVNTEPLLFMEYVPYKETRNYVSTIMRNYYWYKRLTSAGDANQVAQKLLERNLSTLWKPDQIIANMEQ